VKVGRLLGARLRAKVLALVVGILILGFGLLLALNLGRERHALEERHRETARLLAASILTAVENGMIEARPDIIRRLLQELRAQPPDAPDRRYRRNGVEAFTDLETVEAVNTYVGLSLSSSAASRLQRAPAIRPPALPAGRDRPGAGVTEVVDGRRVLTLRALRNEEPRQQCHEPNHQVRGVVRISLGLEALDQEVARARNRQLLVAGLTILGVAASIVVFLGRVVLAPIARVASAARLIGGGDLDARTGAQSADEIGQLGRAIDDMAGHLRAARVELEARNGELASALESLRESTRKLELLEQIKGELSKFVPEAVTRLLEQHPDARELEKREADVSVLFLDVEGYTRLSEQLPPPRLNRMIQDYFSAFLEIIRAQHGDVNETAGDGLMVIFQSDGSQTRHALNAAGAAFRLLTRVAQLNRALVVTYPPVAIHVGINSGPALVGATKLDATGGGRWTFTASGPTTNLAARIAGLTRGGEVKVGPETAARIRDQYALEDTGEHPLKNVAQPVRIYRLVPAGIYSRIE
jgi:class 3 adenylate cyclase/HAMP domain-containing protein